MKSVLALLLGLTGAAAYDCLPDTVNDGVMTFADDCTKVVLPDPGFVCPKVTPLSYGCNWYSHYGSSITEPFSVVLPDSVTEISDYAFEGSPVTSINLNKVWRIGAYAFYSCMELETVVFPTRPYIIEKGAFSFSPSNGWQAKLTTLDFGVTDIDKGKQVDDTHTAQPGADGADNKNDLGYYNCATPGTVSLCSDYDSDNPYDQQTIDMDAFRHAPLTSINLGSVTYIRNGAFRGTFLPNVTIPPSVKQIEAGAFQYMYALEKVIFPSELDPDVFYGGEGVYLTLMGEQLDDGPFTNNAALITVSNVNNYVLQFPFTSNFGNQVKHVTLLDSVTEIRGDAFRSSALESINLNKVQTIGMMAFIDTQLAQVILPSDAMIGYGAFNDAFDTDVVRVDAVLGCTDTTATNYDASANTDDSSCIAVVPGCTDDAYIEYADSANTDDGSCLTLKVVGCRDDTADNYDENANVDGNCEYAPAPPAPPAADPAPPAPTGGCEAGLTATEYQSRGCCEC